MPEYRSAQSISVYLSMPAGEIQTHQVVQDALSQGKKLFVPYIHHITDTEGHSKSSEMSMLDLRSLEDLASLKRDKWGIPSLDSASVEGRENALGGRGIKKAVDHASNDVPKGLHLVVVPGMAFDSKFRRLGHGKGYYDKYLQKYYDQRKDSNILPVPFLGELCVILKIGLPGPNGCLVGIALQEQFLNKEDIPTSELDWSVDALVIGDGKVYRRNS